MLIFWSSLAQAQEFPKYDRQAYCERVTQANSDDPSVTTLCLEAEQAGYQAASAAWAGLPPNVRVTCIDMGVEAGGSYYALSNCVTLYIMATLPK